MMTTSKHGWTVFDDDYDFLFYAIDDRSRWITSRAKPHLKLSCVAVLSTSFKEIPVAYLFHFILCFPRCLPVLNGLCYDLNLV